MNKRIITPESMAVQVDDIVASDIDGEKVMMSIVNGKYYGLEPVGSRIWEMIGEPVKVSALIDALLGLYDVDRETCERDVLAFLNELNKAGIVRVRG